MPAPSEIPEGPRPATPREIQAVIHAEREGTPFLVHRNAEGELVLTAIPPDRESLTIGRSPSADLSIGWDNEVSGLHAMLELAAGEHTLVDDGLSSNGSFVGGERVRGRRRLRDGDMLRFGKTVVMMRIPIKAATEPTVAASDAITAADLSDQQRKVLVALCRPFLDGSQFPTAPTNQEIAEHMFLSVDAVKVHLRALFDKFGVEGLPQNKKRLALVARAMQSGVISARDL